MPLPEDASPGAELRLGVLGELAASRSGTPLDLGGRRQRAVLALLVIARGEVVPAARLAESLWGDAQPANAAGALQSYVSHLRRRLEPGASARSRAGVIVSEASGYAVRVPRSSVDAWQFEADVRTAADLADPVRAAALLSAALDLWRGPAFAEFADEPWAATEIARLTELREVARELLLDRRLGCDDPGVLVPELEALVADAPLREERWRLLVLALYRAGRQADALAALRRARTLLADELGVDPGPRLRELESEVLAQSPALIAAAATPAPPASRGAPVPSPEPPAPEPGAAPAASGGSSPATDLVDRESELIALRRAFDDVVDGRASLQLIEGPAGIGKSRLLHEARRLAAERSMRVLAGRGSVLEKTFGFGLVRQLLEPVVAAAGDAGPLLAGQAATARPVFEHVDPSGLAEREFAVLHGLYWLTANLAREGPLALLVDDLQWCDAGSLRYLAYLGRRLESLPVVVVASVRTGERHEDEPLLGELYDVADPPIRPAPISPEGTARLVRQRLGEHAAAAFVDMCHRTTSGNPLLLRQVLRALEVERVPPDVSHADTVMAVGSRAVSSIVLLRLRRAPAEITAVARAVAVLGDGAELPWVAALAGLDEHEAAGALAALVRAEVLRPDQPLGFAHPLVGEAVYRDLPAGQRELQHQQAARILAAAGVPVEQVAAQLLRAPRRGDTATVETLRAAARRAVECGAADSAVTYLRRALDEPPPPETEPDVRAELAALDAGPR